MREYRPPAAPTPPPSTEWQPHLTTPDLAHPGRRLAARLIDTLTLIAMTVTPLLIVIPLAAPGGGSKVPPAAVAAAAITAFALFYLYEAVQLAIWGRTLGMCLLKMRVASATAPEDPLTPSRAFGRAASYPVFFTVIGTLPLLGLISLANSLWLLWDRPLRQCLHDKMAGTLVLNDPSGTDRPRHALLVTGTLAILLISGTVLTATLR
ncbi:RDD family protein [Actinomadura fibrosa]|uniref:RDD family protein n=1 Tax=Actinomadura fibrosa TaxID=111802 RepID=A0ABW2Y094_9ACTN|nr:RDD family protein [Actinomadura fibrosa]